MTASTAIRSSVPVSDQAVSPPAGLAAPTLDPQVRGWLRIEGLAVGIVGAVLYARLGGDWLWFIPAFLLVDLSAIGYLAGPRLGAFTYDLAHNWAVGFATLGLGIVAGIPIVALAGAVLVAHVGLDRSIGYGLKLQTGFKHTHLGQVGR